MTFDLEAGDVRVTIDPQIGGRIARLEVAGLSLLVPRSDDAIRWGSYPMAPWAGRVRRGRFHFEGRDYSLPITMVPHAIHGTTLARPWTHESDDRLTALADCLKLLLYYSPHEPENVKAIKHAFVARIGAECEHCQVPFFLEFVGYDFHGGDESGVEYAKKKPEIVSKSMEEFSKPEYCVDVLKVEVPVNMQFVEGARANKSGQAAYSKKEAMDLFRRTAEVAKKPFIYLSAGVSDDQFRESLELAIEAKVNFAGVLCGRATWKEGIPVYAKQGLKAFEDWLQNRGVQNIKALNEVLKGAQPWHAKYGGMDKIQKV